MVSSRGSSLRVGAAVCILLLVLPITSADDLGPVRQDDAGSGRDAPDGLSDEITIQPGVLYDAATTGPGIDGSDYYRFTGEAGQVVEARADGFLGCYYIHDANGTQIGQSSCAFAHVPFYPAPAVAELSQTGDHYLSFGFLAPGTYRFGFNLSGPAPEVRTIPLLMGAEEPPAPAEPAAMPEGCNGDHIMVQGELSMIPRFVDDCYHMRTGLNSLDTPNIDVLLVPPVTPYPERDLRTMREAIEMWDDGIHSLAVEMDMQWLADGVHFDVFIADGDLPTDPLWDPEIVVVSSNPVGGAGIGVDPFATFLGIIAPCHGQPNPLASFEDWLALPGFDSHHDNRSGTYTADCEGGGPICYAVNGAIDPAPGLIDFFGLFDLVAHEVGHCLTVGHVGDALDHKADHVPFADIMSYTNQPHDKCVSTLDVQSFAITMGRYLLAEPVGANHPDGPGGSFQVQHPDDHWYASPTGLAKDCPLPEVSILPGGDPAVFPPQDDAGSGRDAPDSNVPDITIEPDVVYQGSSTGILTDSRDTYHFVGTAGQTFTGWADDSSACFGLQTDQNEYIASACNRPGGVQDPLSPGPVVGELPYSGDYYYWIANATPGAYSFWFTLDD